VECRMLLLYVMLQVDVDDVWSWLPDSVVGYTVRGAYKSIISGMVPSPSVSMVSAPLLWRKEVSLKVSIFAWRLFRG